MWLLMALRAPNLRSGTRSRVIGIILLLLSGTANAYIWSSAVPTEVRLVDGGLLLLGDFNYEGVTCAAGSKGIFLPSSDTQFNRKLSVALTAFAMEKRIEVLINDPIATNCVAVSAAGTFPIAYHNYWHLKN